MHDICMCDRDDCPLKTDCMRNPASGAKPHEYRQSWTNFGGDDPADCNDYIPKKWNGREG